MLQEDDVLAVQKLNEAYRRITGELAKLIVGQQEVIEQIMICMFARGHCLLVGVPGLAKTMMIRSLADTLSLKFSRIQFTPDLMPADITGTEVIQEDKRSGTREFKFLPGPVFANVILADEINRTPPKTQAALLEAMQEHQVTVGGQRHRLSEPFFVLATQNPIEQEGTLTRSDRPDAADFIREYVSWGAGPRASQYLVLGAKARAVLHGRHYASCEDIRAVAAPVLRHRIMTNFNAEAEGIRPDDVVRRLCDAIPLSDDDELARGKLPEVFRPADVG
ncbi:MAG: AAA family ATPase [Planctomycetia bacterium]|nr:AAA family ATPase [Planctomycetia bacterium]